MMNFMNRTNEAMRVRQRFGTWVRRRGVEFGELWSIIAAFLYAWRSVAMFDGHLVAPLTSQGMEANGGIWFWALIFNGFVVLTALLIGLLSGNTYRARSYVSLFSSCVWVLVAVAAQFSHLPLSVSIAYVITCVVSWMTAAVLSQKATYAEAKTVLEKQLEGEF